ncbi:hypothetical protein OE88DRAFT_1807654 [Heliocybe sulcata]|uniref:RanBP2-type domain-containing protein n=1 Tax=Heliocybe sulcata TaxID=5364 RepID=A0A5C3N6L1_9AGAM|nr:hypothetical protein OE88DRAFT_1807654 [Heliocybe sulcata]
MSAIRNNNRSALRTSRSSPYARPNDKKSSWSLSGLLSYLNPLRGFLPSQNQESEEVRDAQDAADAPQGTPPTVHKVRFADLPESPPRQQSAPPTTAPLPPSILRQDPQQQAEQQQRQQELRRQIYAPPPPPKPRLPFAFDPSKLPVPPPPPGSEPRAVSLDPSEANGTPRETVVQYLQVAKGRKLNAIEIAGIVSLLKEDGAGTISRLSSRYDHSNKSAEDTDREPFRFSTSPIPSDTPSTSATPQPAKPVRLLAKNPNGVYKWRGAGSARPRPRYHSPGFGEPRSSTSSIKLSPPKTSATNMSKRRRVGPDAETSTAQPVAAPPTSSTPANATAAAITNGIITAGNGTSAAPKMNGTSSLPRIHASGPSHHKATTPVRPSPLRQAWSSEEEPSPPSRSQPPRQTRAAAFMEELVKEYSGSKKSDVANPYQQMMPPQLKTKIISMPTRKTRSAAAKEREEQEHERKEREEREKQKQKDKELRKKGTRLSGQAIIEATLPKGSKRARPPPEMFAKNPQQESAAASSRKSPSPLPAEQRPEVEEVADEEPAAKKQKTEPSLGHGSVQSPEIIELDDDASMDTNKNPASSLFTQPSEVVEPTESADRVSPPKGIPPTTTLDSPFGGVNGTGAGLRPAFRLKSTAPKEPSKLRYSYQAESDSESATSSPKGSKPSPKDAAASLPAFGSHTEPLPAEGSNATPGKGSTLGLSAAPPPAGRSGTLFPSSTPGSSSASTAGASTESVAGSSNASSYPESLVPGLTGPGRLIRLGGTDILKRHAPVGRHNAPSPLGPAIDLSPPPKQAKLPKEAVSAVDADVEEVVPAVDVEEAVPVVDVANASSVAEVKQPAPVKDPKQEALKADIGSLPVFTFTNKAPRVASVAHLKAKGDAMALPASALPTFEFTKFAKTSAPASSGSKPTSGGFDWAAAGMKPPAANAGWTCSVCMVNNKSGAAKCMACEEPAPAGAAKPEPAKAPGAPTGGFNWAAAGMKAPERSDNWLCKVCMCSSPGNLEKCVVCEEPRP